MQAKQFNETYKVGCHFIFTPNPILRGGRIVKTVDVARDFKCGCVVEINREPYFVKVETLTPSH